MVDLVMVSQAVAGLLTSGGAKELGAAATGGTVTQQVHASRGAHVASRGQMITNYRRPGA
jgi:hypothetical protein